MVLRHEENMMLMQMMRGKRVLKYLLRIVRILLKPVIFISQLCSRSSDISFERPTVDKDFEFSNYKGQWMPGAEGRVAKNTGFTLDTQRNKSVLYMKNLFS